MINICHSIPSMGQGSGGPARSVGQLCEALLEYELSVSLLTSVSNSDPIVELNRKVDLVTFSKDDMPHRRWHRGAGMTEMLRLKHRISPLSVIHQHAIWLRSSYETSLFAFKNGIPLVVSPRGMLEPWSLNHHKLKKSIAWALYQRRCLARATLFHATAVSEAESIRGLGFSQPIAVIPNGIIIPKNILQGLKKTANKTVLFLSRIHAKKGVLELLDVWKSLSPSGWRLKIAGNDFGNDYLPLVEKKIMDLQLGGSVEVVGPLFGAEKEKAFLNADLFILPSYSENFGIVVAESLSYGVPVITTKGTPWSDLEEYNCGWWVEMESGSLSKALQEAFSMTDSERLEMGARGRAYVRRYNWESIAEQMAAVYFWLQIKGEKPTCVLD